MENDTLKLVTFIAQAIYDKKGFNIVAIDVKNISPMTDCLIIAEGNVERHVKALCNAIEDKIVETPYEVLHTEGEVEADWIVMDLGAVMVHLFTPELRERYALDELWKEGKLVDLQLACEKE